MTAELEKNIILNRDVLPPKKMVSKASQVESQERLKIVNKSNKITRRGPISKRSITQMNFVNTKADRNLQRQFEGSTEQVSERKSLQMCGADYRKK